MGSAFSTLGSKGKRSVDPEVTADTIGELEARLEQRGQRILQGGSAFAGLGKKKPAQEQTTPEQGAVQPEIELKETGKIKPFHTEVKKIEAKTQPPKILTEGEGIVDPWGGPGVGETVSAFTPEEIAEKRRKERERVEAMKEWNKRKFMSFEEMQEAAVKVETLPGWKEIDYDTLDAADKQGVWIMQSLQQGMPMEAIEQELAGLQEPMYGPDDLIADIATGFAYSGYRLAYRAAEKGAVKAATTTALKGVGLDVTLGGVAGGAMTVANMATDNMLVTTVSGLLSPAGAKVFFSMSRASLKQWLKSFATRNPKAAKQLSEAIEEVEVKTDGGKEIKKTIKEQVDEATKEKIKKAREPAKPAAPAKPVEPKKPELKKPKEKPKKPETDHEKIQKLAGDKKKVAVDAVLKPEEHGMKGAQITIKDKDSPAHGATLTIEGDITKKKIQKAVSDKEKLFKKAEEKAVPKTKSFTKKQVKGALDEADVKKPKVVKETKMKGEEFLNLTTGSDVRKDAIKKKVKEAGVDPETKKQAPILVVDEKGKVIAHDGRHRAAAAAEKGEDIKTLVVSEKDFVGGTLSSQKFGTKDRKFKVEMPKVPEGKVPDLRKGITGEGTLPKPKTATKPRPWSKLTRVAVINRKTGEVMESTKELPFQPTKRKNVDAVNLETRRLRKEMMKKHGVHPDDIENGWIAKDNLEFVPRKVQEQKPEIKAWKQEVITEGALKQTKAKQMAEFDSKTREIIRAAARREAKLKKMAKVGAVHRVVAKKTQTEVQKAVRKWWGANPELRKGMDIKDIESAAKQAAFEHLRLTPMKDLKKFVEGNKTIQRKVRGLVYRASQYASLDYSKELIKQRHALASIDAVKKAIDEGTLKTPLEFREEIYAGGKMIEPAKADDLLEGIQDPDIRRAAQYGMSPEDLAEGMEAAAKKVSAEMAQQRDLRLKGMQRVSMPKPGKAPGLGQKEMSKRARKAKRKRLFKRELEARRRGELIKKTEAEVQAEKAKQAEIQKKIKKLKAERDEAFAKEPGITDKDVLKRKKYEQDKQKELEEQRKAEQSGEFRLGQRQAQLERLQEADKLMKAEGYEPLIKLSAKEAENVERTKKFQEGLKSAQDKDLDALKNRPKELEKLGLADLAALRRKAIRTKKDALVKEIETVMLKKQQELEVSEGAKLLQKTSGGTELYSGIPMHKIQTLVLDRFANVYFKYFDAADKKLSKYLRGKILQNDRLTWAVSGLVEDFGLTPAYKILRRHFQQSAHRWATFSDDMKQAIKKIDGDFEIGSRKIQVSKKAAQLRARQIAGGSLTAVEDKFDAVLRASNRFKTLEQMLYDRGLLKQHQFRRLNNKELAKTNRILFKMRQKEKEILKKVAALKETDPRFDFKLNDYTNQLKALENARIEKVTQLQIHYKNAGKNYFSLLANTMKKQKVHRDEMISIQEGLGRLDKRYAIRRENWQVSLGQDGRVVVSQKGKPMKMKAADLGEQVHKGISVEARDAYLFDLFNKIAKSNRWSRKSAAPGFRKLKGDPENWGPLGGMFVSTPVYNELMGAHKQITHFEKRLHRLMGTWKEWKVIWSPRAQFRNIVSNVILGDVLADVSLVEAIPKHLKNVFDLGMLKLGKEKWDAYLAKQAKVKKMSKLDQDIIKAFKYDTTLMDTTFAKAEVEDAMNWIDLRKIGKEGTGLNALMTLFQKAKMTPTKAYKLVEEGMKLTLFRKEVKNALQEMGVKDLDELGKFRKQRVFNRAERVANYALFDYGKVPRAIRWARHGYSPFITFTYKAIPRLTKTFARKPWKLMKWLGGLWALQEAFNIMSGDNPEDIEYERRNLPDYMQRNTLWGLPGQHSHLRLPWKTEDGRTRYFDLSFLLPWGDISEGFGSGNLMSRSIMPNHPFWNFVGDIRSNEDVFLDKPLTYSHDKFHEKAIKYMKHAWKQVAPGALDSAFRTWDRVMKRPRDWRGREDHIAYFIADAWFGLKVRNVEAMETAMFKHKDLEKEMQEMYKEMVQRYTDITFKQNLSPEKYQEEYEKLMQEINEDYENFSNKVFYIMNGDDDK